MPLSVHIPLAVLLIPYALFLCYFSFYAFFNLYLLLRFGIYNPVAVFVIIIFSAGSIFLLAASSAFLLSYSWSSPMDFSSIINGVKGPLAPLL